MTDRLGQIEVFAHVVQTGSFSAAARFLSLSPSTVSKVIARLEDRLGVRLFNRTSRVVNLTPEGKEFYESSMQVLRQLDEAENHLRTHKGSPRGMLRVAASPTITNVLLAPILPDFLRSHPHMRIDLHVRAGPNVGLSVEAVESGIDVVLLSGELDDSMMVARKIAVSRWLTCASPAYLATHGKPRTPDDLLAHNCLNFPVPTYRTHWPFREKGAMKRLHVRGCFTSNGAEVLRQLTLSGIGIARLAEYLIADDLASGKLVRVLEDHEVNDEDPIYAVYQNHRNISPRIKAFVDFLHDACRQKPSEVRGVRPPLPVQPAGRRANGQVLPLRA